MFSNLQPAPPDAILGLTEAFRLDASPCKVNLGVGVYKDDAGGTPILECVKEAERRLAATETTKTYLPISGSPAYGRHVQALLFGAEVPDRARTAHTPGGTGGLRVGGDLIRELSPAASVWLSRPTWANHQAVFAASGLAIREYPYYRPERHDIDFDALRETLDGVPAGDIVLLHVCCHNPTGVDLTGAQWSEVARLAAARGWIPFLDFAYQGFGDGLAEDAAGLQPFLAAGLEFFVASSFSKNFGLYCERAGALTLVARSAAEAETAFSHLKVSIRRNYSNPPAHGGNIVATILGDDALRACWLRELAGMRDRIRAMRSALVAGLAARGVAQEFSFIERQRGMFSFSGLSDEQVARLRTERSIYIVRGGRINVAGITTRNLDYLCDAVAEVLA